MWVTCVCFCVSECGEEGSWGDLKAVLGQMPDVHHRLLSYLCRFLTEVESHHAHNRMTALNLATVFGPSVFQSVPLTCYLLHRTLYPTQMGFYSTHLLLSLLHFILY